MKAVDVFRYAFSDFAGSRFKTLMSSLGIIVGVLAIVVMLTLGEGLYQGVSSALGDMQLDTMTVVPGSLDSGTQAHGAAQKPLAELTDRDVAILQNVPGVADVSPEIDLRLAGTYKGENQTVTLAAVEPRLEHKTAEDLSSGRYLSQDDVYSVVVGSKAADDLFGQEIRAGTYLTLTDPYTGVSHEYKVAGILKPQNGSVLTGDPDDAVFVSTDGLRAIANVSSYSWINVRADSVGDADAVAAAVQDALGRVHRNEAFAVITQKMFSEAVGQIFTLIRLVLAGIGAVSLVVGGIGIANVMMLSVQERVKEIGLMKAVGATSAQVRYIFLAESQLIGLASGIVGVLAAVVVSAAVGSLAGLPMGVTPTDAVAGVVFALLTTLVAGVFPAARAARLNPIEALRAE